MAELRGAAVFTVGITTGGLLAHEHGLLHPAAAIAVTAGTIAVLASERCSRHLVWIIRALKDPRTGELTSHPETPTDSPSEPPGPPPLPAARQRPEIPTIRRISRPGWVQRRLGGSTRASSGRPEDPPVSERSRSA